MRRLDEPALTAFAPDLLFAEVANGLLGYVAAGTVTRAHALEDLEFVCALPLDVWSSRQLAPAALEIGSRLGLSAYDACYVALAHAQDALLVTADRRLAAAIDRSDLVA